MAIRILVLAPIVCVLVACGGGGSSVQPQAEAPQDTFIVSAYGDSTQAAQGQPHAASRAGAKIYNRGVGSTNTSHLLAGTDGLNYAWEVMMTRDSAPIVVVNHGINDYAYPLEKYRSNLLELVRIARAAGKIPMLELPNPAGETRTALMDQIAFDVTAFEARRQAMRDVANSEGVYLCDQPRVPLSDGIHPTPEGYKTKADRLAACLADLMG